MPTLQLADAEVEALGEGRLVVRDRWLGDGLARAAAAAVRELDDAGRLVAARVGKERRLRPEVRGDRRAWFSELELPPALRRVWAAFEAMRGTLRSRAWLPLKRFELQVACYPGDGTRYAAHRDAFAGDLSRRVTAIVYLNPDWQRGDGGELVAHLPEGRREVAPVLDRLVLFRSECVLHEVLPAHTERFAVTAWFREDPA